MALKIIKKYKNRRLYDTSLSKYITFDDIKAYVLEKQDFQVIDSNSGEDITTGTLLQVIIELEVGQSNTLSNEFLRNIIIYSQHPMFSVLSQMLESSLKILNDKPLNEFNKSNQLFMKNWVDSMDTFYKNWQQTGKNK